MLNLYLFVRLFNLLALFNIFQTVQNTLENIKESMQSKFIYFLNWVMCSKGKKLYFVNQFCISQFTSPWQASS